MTSSTPASVAPTVGFTNLLVSEWTKLRTLRSTYITALIAALGTVAVAVIVCVRYVQLYATLAPGNRTSDVTNLSLTGIYGAQIALGALGVLAISGEYGTSMIHGTLTAVPQRRLMLASKALVLVIATAVLGEIASFAGFGLGQAILSGKHLGVSLGDSGVARAVVGAGVYLAASALLGFGLGALIRHTAGALSAYFGLLYAGTALIDLLPTNWRNDLINYMPVNAGSQVMVVEHVPGALSAWAGFGVFLGMGAAALAAGVLTISYRDI